MVSNLKSYLKLKINGREKEEEATEQEDGHITQRIEPLTTKISIGTYIQDARVKAGLSINQVSQKTKIHVHYLEAIERDDFANTPPFIYVRAYVKKLCDLYEISEDTAMSLLEVFQSEREPLPEKLIQDLKETKQVNENDVEKVKSYVKLIGMSTASFIILLVILGAVLISRRDRDIIDKPLTTTERTQLQKDIEKLVAPQRIDMNELKTVAKNN
jgi:cytoskeletal protein RodZ